VTTGSPTARFPGAIGQQGTAVLYGDKVENGDQFGGRLTGGVWLNEDHSLGIDGGLFFLSRQSVRFSAASQLGQPILAVPFFDVRNNREGSSTIGVPGRTSGGSTLPWPIDSGGTTSTPAPGSCTAPATAFPCWAVSATWS
jgi:hypothetical protein